MVTGLWRAVQSNRQTWASSSRLLVTGGGAAGSSVVGRKFSVQNAQSVQLQDATSSSSSAAAPLTKTEQGESLSDILTYTEAPSEYTEEGNQLHVNLQYLLPSSKPPPSLIRAGDARTGRIRPDKVYVPLSKYVFGIPPRRDLLHSAVIYYLDGIRKGTASTKTRGEVAFSGKKIRPQKGSGQARLGTRSNPLLRKGGVIFGPRPRDMSSKLNRRVRELALRSVLSAKWNQGQLCVVKNFEWVPPPNSTSYLKKILSSKQWNDALFLTAPRHPQASISTSLKPNPKPSASDPIYTKQQQQEHGKAISWFTVGVRNIVRTEVVRLDELAQNAVDSKGKELHPELPGELHAYSILKRKMLVCDVGAVEWLEEKLGGAIFHSQEVESLAKDLSEITSEEADAEEEEEEDIEEYEKGDVREADYLVNQLDADRPQRRSGSPL